MILNDLTQKQVDSFVRSPSHALLLVGPKGSGKRTLANYVVQEIVGTGNINEYPYGKVVKAQEGKSIGIEIVRELEHFLSLKVPSSTQTNRFMIFEDAHLLTHEAQNALLKTLEEPPQGSIIVMTSSHEQALLPTIRSRTQVIRVNKPPIAALESYFVKQGHDVQNIKKITSISGGLPGLMHTLLTDKEHPLNLATDYSRQILSQGTYERLLLVDELAKNKALSLDVCFILQQMAHVSLQKATGESAKKWHSVMESAYKASENLTQNAQSKLALDNLMLNL